MSKLAIFAVGAALALAGCGSDGDSGGEGADTDAGPPFSTSGWETDFAKHTVPLDEFQSGGPPKDGIPSIDEPKFVSTSGADEFLSGDEPVAVVEIDGQTRAYPIQILIWHEIVNDELAGEPIAVTYCPLCNSTVAFERTIDGEAVEFGTTGMLRKSDLVMYDRATESWWQQLTAEAVVGERAGEKLEVIPSQILAWSDFKDTHPDAEVLSRDTGSGRDYGSSPYGGYDSNPNAQPFLLDEEADRSLPPKERVSAVQTGEGEAVVFPFSTLRRDAPINDEIDGTPAVVFYDPDVASALDAPALARGRAVGASAVFERRAGGRTLSFEQGPRKGTFTDRQTGSEWDMQGRAVSGSLQGERLKQIPHDDQFWFALAAFIPDAEIRS